MTFDEETNEHTMENEPAFPVDKWGNQEENMFGLTKREYFAVMAMQGMHASTPGSVSEDISAFAVNSADALIKELQRTR